MLLCFPQNDYLSLDFRCVLYSSHYPFMERHQHSSRQGIFSQNVLVFFSFSKKIYTLWYSLEAPRRGASNEYPQHMFSCRSTKNIYRIPNPLFWSCTIVLKMLNRVGKENTAYIQCSTPSRVNYVHNIISWRIYGNSSLPDRSRH